MTENGVSYVWLIEDNSNSNMNTAEIPHVHDYRYFETVLPTCTELGYDRFQCSGCGTLQKTNYVPANGHTDGEWKVTKQPTLTSEGTKTLYCSVCGKVIRTESIPKLTQGRVYRVKVDDVSLNYKKSTTLKPGIEADNGVTVSNNSGNASFHASKTLSGTVSNPSSPVTLSQAFNVSFSGAA